MKWFGVACIIVCMAVVQVPAFGQEESRPEASVFQVVAMSNSGGGYRGVSFGTAFFIDADGTALTNSHVVYPASHDPGRYQLLAIVGPEFYSATIVCASILPQVPSRSSSQAGVRLSRDVAVIKLAPSKFPFTRLGYTEPNGRSELVATAHLRALPRFPALTLGSDPAPGDNVRVVGFGDVTAFTVKPKEWISSGVVSEIGTASDGTTVFRIESIQRAGPGGSGSPVLDGQDRVVGIYTWGERSSSAYSEAIGSSALADPCPE